MRSSERTGVCSAPKTEKMPSLFNLTSETKQLDGAYLTAFQPSNTLEGQLILVKGKLGQFKLVWPCEAGV